MRTYSMITKPYRIRLKPGEEHTLVNPLTQKLIAFYGEVEFWCCRVYSQDHGGYQSLMVFNHSTYSTFSVGHSTLTKKWNIVPSDKNWKDEIEVLKTSLLDLNCFTDGTIPKFVPKEFQEKNKQTK